MKCPVLVLFGDKYPDFLLGSERQVVVILNCVKSFISNKKAGNHKD